MSYESNEFHLDESDEDGVNWSQAVRHWILSCPGFEKLECTDTVKTTIDCANSGIALWITKQGERFSEATFNPCECEPDEIDYVLQIFGIPSAIGTIQRLGNRIRNKIRKWKFGQHLGADNDENKLPIQDMDVTDVDDEFIPFVDQHMSGSETFFVTVSFTITPFGFYEVANSE